MNLHNQNYIEGPKKEPSGRAIQTDLIEDARAATARGKEFLLSIQRDDFYWCAELEANPTITAEYVFLRQILGLDLGAKKDKIIRYLLKLQNADGSWGTRAAGMAMFQPLQRSIWPC